LRRLFLLGGAGRPDKYHCVDKEIAHASWTAIP
jgi:hypothetical protein